MRFLLIQISFLLLPLFAWSALTQPKVTNSSSIHKVELGGSVIAALKKFDKNFKMLETRHYLPNVVGYFDGYPGELPMAVAGDFNGDGLEDVVVMGLSKEKTTLVIKALLIYSQPKKNKYSVLPVDQWSTKFPRGKSFNDGFQQLNNLEMYLGLTDTVERQENTLPQKRDSFKVEVFQKQTDLLYFEAGAIKKPKVAKQ